jgi:hypothetical protein
MSIARALCVAAIASLALASCTSRVPDVDTVPVDPRPTTPAVELHRVGNCYDLSVSDLDDPTSTVRSVRCSRPHTATTVALLRASTVQGSHRDVADRCARAVALHLGVGVAALRATMIEPVWFLPDPGVDDRIRCDFVAFVRAGELLDLPRRTHHLFDRLSFADSLRICGTAKPGAADFERVSCGHRHSWRVVETLDLRGRGYPGAKALRKQGDHRCAERVREEHDFALKFAYGWEWPTREQWAAGQRYGLCWTTD